MTQCFSQVLRFYAYFQETVQEKREELYRTRYCSILFHLEDDTIQVNEQKAENSGIPQGNLHLPHFLTSSHLAQMHVLGMGGAICIEGEGPYALKGRGHMH